MRSLGRSTTEGDPYRFFSPEQVDKILCEGARRGRAGSHAAIERVLKLEPGIERAELWQRIRQLKYPAQGARYRRVVWSADDDQILSRGYEKGWSGKQEAIRELLKRHPDRRPHLIWRRAAKLHLTRKAPKRGQERSRLAWSEDDDRILLNLAGYKTSRVIAKILHRSEVAVRYRLTVLGKSSRFHLEGFARHALARDLHVASSTIQRLIAGGLLEVRDPRITRESLDNLCKSSRLDEIRQNVAPESGGPTTGPDGKGNSVPVNDPSAAGSTGLPTSSGKFSRAKRVWAEVAESLGIAVEAVQNFVARGVLKLYDPTITEKSLRHFCRRYGSLIDYDFLNRETREWLQSSMDWVRTAGESTSRRLAPLRKHARVTRHCTTCGREIRGNAFFRHIKRCDRGISANNRQQTVSMSAQ
jgi:hypothetical protein